MPLIQQKFAHFLAGFEATRLGIICGRPSCGPNNLGRKTVQRPGGFIISEEFDNFFFVECIKL